MKKCTRFVGLDDSKASIDVAVASEGRDGEVRFYGTIANTLDEVKKLVRRLGRPKDLHFVYEAGPCGYGVYRELLALGTNCMVAAPSKTPRRSGDRIKTDRRDALELARLHRAGELHPVWVPDEETEAMRDLTRAREDFKYVQTRARQRLQSFLLRHGRRYPGRSHWTKTHLKWLAEQKFAQSSQQVCLDEYVEMVRQASERVQRLEEQVRELVSTWSMGPVVSAMTAHRGVSLVVAATVCAELGDLTRFDRVRELMGFVGLVPSLHATGVSRRSGAITKTGNAHVRRVLVEAAWAYRHPARRTAHLRKKLDGQPEEVQAISWKGQLRLCGKHRRMIARGKHPNKVTVAIARELLAFLWGTARMVSPMSTAA
jgi:transposase